ncbi:hypothetical protein GCM10026982_62390 [Nocardiopsis aegyptia]
MWYIELYEVIGVEVIEGGVLEIYTNQPQVWKINIYCYDSSPTRSGLGDEIESRSLTKQ